MSGTSAQSSAQSSALNQATVAAVEYIIRSQLKLSQEQDPAKLSASILGLSLKLGNACAGSVYLLNQSKQSLRCATRQPDSAFRANETLNFNDPSQERHPLISCCKLGKALQLDLSTPATHQHSQGYVDRNRSLQQTLHRVLLLPMLGPKNNTLGVLELLYPQGTAALENGFIDLLQAYAAQGSIALNNLLLAQENQQLLNQLNQENQALNKANAELRLNASLAKMHLAESHNPLMKQVYHLADKVAPTQANVLLTGETGAGKEVIAKYIQQTSRRSNQPFISQNCAALPEQLLEGELFGYEKGAFTGADKAHPGLIRAANGGTLFLDEVGDLPLSLQAKLLRVIQERSVRPLGSNTEHPVDFRLITATHQDLAAQVEKDQFRRDLYYRLKVFPIHIPPLRERLDDIPHFVTRFVSQICQSHGITPATLTNAAIEKLQQYNWPGNVRELKHCLEHSLVLAAPNTVLDAQDIELQPSTQQHTPAQQHPAPNGKPVSCLKTAIRQYEERIIHQALDQAEGNVGTAAKALNIPRTTLISKLKTATATPTPQ